MAPTERRLAPLGLAVPGALKPPGGQLPFSLVRIPEAYARSG